MKINKRHKRLIRGPGGRFASEKQIKAVIRAKQKHPEKTYADLSEAWIKRNRVTYQKREREPETGRIISKKAVSEINKAAKQLGISREKAKALYLENKIIKSVQGDTLVFHVGTDIDAYFERVKGFYVKVKGPGDKKYKIYKTARGAKLAIARIKAEIFKQIREGFEDDDISTDNYPVVEIVDLYFPGEFLPVGQQLDFSNWSILGSLTKKEKKEILSEVKKRKKK